MTFLDRMLFRREIEKNKKVILRCKICGLGLKSGFVHNV